MPLVLTAARRQSLCIATQERKLLAREKGVLESILKSTMEEISRMLEVEALNNEQVVRTNRSGADSVLECWMDCPRLVLCICVFCMRRSISRTLCRGATWRIDSGSRRNKLRISHPTRRRRYKFTHLCDLVIRIISISPLLFRSPRVHPCVPDTHV